MSEYFYSLEIALEYFLPWEIGTVPRELLLACIAEENNT
jgi:hypothetical protein